MAMLIGSMPVTDAAADDAVAKQGSADEVAARAIAAEMKMNAGQQGAVRVAAKHFADQLESHHYPASPGDGVASGAQVAKAIGGSLATYQKAVKDYRMDEKVSLQGNTVTITSLTSGTYSDGNRFDDVSVVAYQVKNGKIWRADAIHTNPGAIQKAMRGSDDRAAADHRAAEKIAAEMRASGGRGLEVAQKYFAERVAAWSPDHLDRSALHEREPLRTGMASEMAAIRKALDGYANREAIEVQGNKILLDGRMTGTMSDGRSTWGDTKLVLAVTDGSIVGIESSHSAEGRENLRKVLSAAGFKK